MTIQGLDVDAVAINTMLLVQTKKKSKISHIDDDTTFVKNLLRIFLPCSQEVKQNLFSC